LLLRKTVLESLPTGFQEEMSYGMLGYVVPHTLYPDGYHCNKLPLPFISIAAQKNFVGFITWGFMQNQICWNGWYKNTKK
jgi:hypothetical protein